VTDAIPTPDEQEVASLTYFTLEELQALLKVDPAGFSPPFGTLLEWYVAHHSAAD
jgi:isopentenyldiphosphate isomerase